MQAHVHPKKTKRSFVCRFLGSCINIRNSIYSQVTTRHDMTRYNKCLDIYRHYRATMENAMMNIQFALLQLNIFILNCIPIVFEISCIFIVNKHFYKFNWYTVLNKNCMHIKENIYTTQTHTTTLLCSIVDEYVSARITNTNIF